MLCSMNTKRLVQASLLLTAAALAPGCGSGLHQGAVAPDFELNDLDGTTVRLSQHGGDVVLLGFFGVG